MSDELGRLVDPRAYGRSGAPHELLARLRRDQPVARCEIEGLPPFWALTRHADIREVSTHPRAFVNGQGFYLEDAEEDLAASLGVKTLLHMDPPEHRAYRQIASNWFTPKNLRVIEMRVREAARELVDRMAEQGCEVAFDFVSTIADHFPLRLISQLVGIPPEEEPYLLRFSNEMFGSVDPDFEREGGREATLIEAMTRFSEVMEDRRRQPRDDLASVIANAEIAGEQIGAVDVLSYYALLLAAGHETTRTALTGGLATLIEHPDQLLRLRSTPSLIGPAVDEIVRWVSPVNYFARTAVEDYELHDVKIRSGDKLAMFFASANRDEAVFEAPYTFSVDRTPNPHLGFGIGEHFCLGGNLARMELRIFLEEMVPRLAKVEFADEPTRLVSNLISGYKRLPIRCRVT